MPNGNERGNVSQRRARRRFIMEEYGVAGIVVCYMCGLPMFDSEFTIDRILPGIMGGTYARDNIRPSCRKCSDQQGRRLQGAGSR